MSTKRSAILFRTVTLTAFGGLSASFAPAQNTAPEVAAAAPAQPAWAASENREHAYWSQRVLGRHQLPPDAYERALGQWRLLRKTVPPAQTTPTTAPLLVTPNLSPVSGVNGTVWTPIGPSPIRLGNDSVNGRVHALAISPNNPNVIFQGVNIGGVWKSIDGGLHWFPLFDQQIAMGVGQPSAIALDPNNTDTIYVGTNPRFQASKGIFKSTDGGASWVVLGSGYPAGNTGNAFNTFANQHVSGLIVDPANSSVLYAAANNGLFRSTDGGLNWSNSVNGGGGPRLIFQQSLVLDPTSPAANRILYAGIDGNGVRKSTDGGQTWAQILSVATPAVATAVSTGSVGTVSVALAPPTSPANPAGIQVIYVTLSGLGGAPDPLGIFESTDQGTNWTQRVASVSAFDTLLGGTQGGLNLELGVDPGSPGDGANDILYLGCVKQARSVNSGTSFSSIANGLHSDTRSTWGFVRAGGNTIAYTGNDGGLYRTTDGGATWSGTSGSAPPTLNAGGLQTALCFHMDVKRDAAASDTLISLQDNGSAVTTGIPLWTTRTGGDGWDVAWDAVNTDTAYESHNVSSSLNGIFKSTDGAATFNNNISDGIATTDLAIFGTTGVNVVNVDPQNANVMYVSGSSNGLWRTTDAATFTRIQSFPSSVSAVDVAPANSNNLAAVVGATRVFVTANALGATPAFTEITGNLPGRTVTQVGFDPNDPTVLYATLSGFNSQTPGQPGHVFRRDINSGNWTDISPPVDVPHDALALDPISVPTTIYVGTDLGVLRSVDGGATWAALDDVHLPNIPVTDLKINAKAGVLRAGTFGRGVFEFANPNGPVIAVNAQNGLAFGVGCTAVPQWLTIQIFNVGTSNLIINSVQRLMGSANFTVLPNPATPLIISPNAEVDFTVQYLPTTVGPQQATLRIASSDPGVPYFDLTATGTTTNATIATVIANSGNFGDVCLGTFSDLNFSVNNSGACDLLISNIVFSLPSQFQIPTVVTYPLAVHPGDTLNIPVRFQPTSFGAKTNMIMVTSNDPQSPLRILTVYGNAPSGIVRLTGSTDFGDVCAGTLAERTINVCNLGKCDLHVASFGFSPACPDFTVVNNPFPATVSHDFCLPVAIRLTPSSCGPKTCTLVVVTDDPNSPTNVLTFTANTPCPSIDVSPDLGFLPEVIQSLGTCTTPLPFPISNKGQCNLTVTGITIGGTNAGDYSLSGLPSFPIILQPGHLVGEGDLNVVFAPTVVARERTATLTVTCISDPVTGATTSITRKLCGEGVYTGARVLVMQGGIPVATVEKLQLQRINANRNKGLLDTLDVAQNLPLVTVLSDPPCAPFQYHREYGTVSNPIQLLPGSYQVTASAIINGKRKSLTVGFDVNTCDFNPTIVINF